MVVSASAGSAWARSLAENLAQKDALWLPRGDRRAPPRSVAACWLRLSQGRPAEIDCEQRPGACGNCGEQARVLGKQLFGVETSGGDLVLEEDRVGAARVAQQPGRGQRRTGQQPAADDQAGQP